MLRHSPTLAQPNPRFRLKLLEDGRAALNLGCGTRMHRSWNNLDFSLSILLSRHPAISNILRKLGVLSQERYEKLLRVAPDAIYWNLAKGIPFADDTLDIVYHSHVLEHFDRELAPEILKECFRVLKRNGIIRVVVPNLQILINKYNASVTLLQQNKSEAALEHHYQAIYDLFEQMVRREMAGTQQQRKVVRRLENLVRGDASQTGEIHRWMYDSYSLEKLLAQVGFKDIRVQTPFTSRIAGWTSFNLDTDADGTIDKPDSLYMEGVK